VRNLWSRALLRHLSSSSIQITNNRPSEVSVDTIKDNLENREEKDKKTVSPEGKDKKASSTPWGNLSPKKS